MADRLELDTYVVDTLMFDLVGHDRKPSAYLVYLHLWRRTDGGARSSGPWSLRRIGDATGVSKRSVQNAVAWLERRQLVVVERHSPYAAPEYRVLAPWRRSASRPSGTPPGS